MCAVMSVDHAGYLAHAGSLVKQWSDEVKYQSRLITAKDPREAICDLATEEKVRDALSARVEGSRS